MTYRTYIEQATADGYPLRYVRVRERVRQWVQILAYFVVPFSVIPGCNAIHGAYPQYSFLLLIIWSLLAGLVLFALVVVFSKPEMIGFIDLTKEKVIFLDENHQLVREIDLWKLDEIREKGLTSERKGPFQGSGGYLHLEFVMTDNSFVSCICNTKPFFKERHDNASVPVKLLHEWAWNRHHPYPDNH